MEFVWEGDLDDDCSCKSVEGFIAHAESMGYDDCRMCGYDNEGDGSDCENCGEMLTGSWYCSVYERKLGASRMIFHSTDHDVHPLTGRAARALCEIVILAFVTGRIYEFEWPLKI